jgi:hypothetical protein
MAGIDRRGLKVIDNLLLGSSKRREHTMKHLFFSCALMAAGVAFGTDEVIVSQPFDFENMVNALTCSGLYMLADDMTPSGYTPLGIIEFWPLYTGSPVTTWKFQVRNDSASRPGSAVLWTADVTNITNTATGLYGWGYQVYDCVATPTPGQLYHPVPATKVWFCLQSQGGSTAYVAAANQTWTDPCCQSPDNGSSWVITWYEVFMIITGTPDELESDTWGSIKNTF